MIVTPQNPDVSRQSYEALSVLRPAERVLRFLETEFPVNEEFRLPSIREIARRVAVSSATVQSVFQKLAESGRIRTERGSACYLLPVERPERRTIEIGMNIPSPDRSKTSGWHSQIYAGILHGLLSSGDSVSLRPLPPRSWECAEVAERAVSELKTCDGLILFPFGLRDRLGKLAKENGKAVVYLNPEIATATTNFVSPDYYESSRQLGEVWRKTGRRRILVLMRPGPEESVSVQLRRAGLLAGLGDELGKTIAVRMATVPRFPDVPHAKAMVAELLESGGFRPDAIYCGGDGLALGAIEAVREFGMKIPEEISIVAGHWGGASVEAANSITSMRQPLEETGELLVESLLARIRNKNADRPGRYLPISFVPRSTTTLEENALFADLAGARST